MSNWLVGVVAVFFGAMLSGCSEPKREASTVDIEEVKKHLQILSSARVLLGHQSVGRDILAGVRTLSAEAGVPLRIEQINGMPVDDGPGLFHSHIGANGDPSAKCEAFETLLTRPERPAYDLAMMKFCYVDLDRNARLEAGAMLDRYARAVERIHTHRPEVALVHISLPLMDEWRGWKVTLNRMIGREVAQDRDNEVRNAFNDGLRKRFAGQPLFDLAGFESTYADGSRSSFKKDGREIYTLAPEYTHDGGHLNEQGQRWVASQFVRTLAETLQQRQGAQSATSQASL